MPMYRHEVTEFAPKTWCLSEFKLVNAFLVEGEEKAALIDTGCGIGDIAGIVRELTDKPLVILITHGHHDHIGDTVSIAKRTGCLVICNPEIESYLHKKGVTNTHGMNIGGAYQFDFGIVKMTSALHSSALEEDGQMIYMGNPGGFLIKAEGYTIYHAGDTGLSHEMTLLGNANRIDVALLPIGGNYTMDVSDAMLAARALRAKQIVPMHYNTFHVITQNEKF